MPQGSVLSPLLCNIYIHDLPDTMSRKYGYADDLAIMLRLASWEDMEDGLNRDMGILAEYLQRWRLQLSIRKTTAVAFHLNSQEAKRELDIVVNYKHLSFHAAPTYLGVKFDRMLSFKQHLEAVKSKVTTRVALIRRLAGMTWGASAKMLRISTQALVFSTAEYCAPVWCKSPQEGRHDNQQRFKNNLGMSQDDSSVPCYLSLLGSHLRNSDDKQPPLH